jgi:hypothetical protein
MMSVPRLGWIDKNILAYQLSESVAHWKHAELRIQGSDVVGSDLRTATTFISNVHPCTAPAHSLHSLITSTHRPGAHLDGANARQKRPPTFYKKIKCKKLPKPYI